MEFYDVIKRRKMVRLHRRAAGPRHRGPAFARGQPGPVGGLQSGLLIPCPGDSGAIRAALGLLYEQTESEGTTDDNDAAQVTALKPAPLVIVPLASKNIYLDRYAQPGKGWTDRDEARWPIPYWYIDTGFAALLIMLAVVEEGLGHVFFSLPDAARARFAVPPEWTPIGAIAIGHPDPASDPVGPARASDRKPLSELVHRGTW